MEKARNNQLVGWSFGFYANSDEIGAEGETETRTVTDLDLIEVSILDDTKSPAYYGTSIEARSENEKVLEYRSTIEEIEDNAMQEHEKVYEESEKQHQEIEKQKEEEKLELIVEKVALKVLEKLNGTGEEKTIPEETPVEDRNEKLDYSSFEDRIAKL